MELARCGIYSRKTAQRGAFPISRSSIFTVVSLQVCKEDFAVYLGEKKAARGAEKFDSFLRYLEKKFAQVRHLPLNPRALNSDPTTIAN